RGLPSWLLGQAARRAHDLVSAALAPEGLRRQHFTLLAALAERGPASQADLGRQLWVDRSDLHAIVSTLEDQGLVVRRADPNDQRRKVVAITGAGTRKLKRLETRIVSAQEEVLAPLEAAERGQLLALLRRLST
ncbi:MAG: MarR family transcriptional regulator, partial [Solirubrobacterales bacterium]|nr:MarR family transcriptional regulator [Solirubrobacterales bacterium]